MFPTNNDSEIIPEEKKKRKTGLMFSPKNQCQV